MQFSDSINTDIPRPIKYANSESSSFLSDTSSSDDESSNTTHLYTLDTSLNCSSYYNTIIKSRGINPYHTRIRHPTDNSSLLHLKIQLKIDTLNLKIDIKPQDNDHESIMDFFTLQNSEPLVTHNF